MPAEVPTPPERRPNRRVLYVAGSAIVALVLFLLLFNTKKGDAPPAPPVVQGQSPKPLFVPRELAAHESLDRDGVLAYCRRLKPAPYD